MEGLDEVLEAAHRLETRLLFLRDRDELSEEAIDRLTDTGVVHVLQRREIENYLLDAAAVHGVISARLEAVPADYTPDRVAERMQEIAADLKPIVVLKRVAFTIKPLRLITRREVAELAEAGASKDRLLGHVQGRLPAGDLVEEIAAAWDREEQDIQAQWDEHWLELVPGADVLSELFRDVGLTYNKGTDGQRLAAIVAVPEELEQMIAGFIE